MVAVDTPDNVPDLHPVGLGYLNIPLHLWWDSILSEGGEGEGWEEGG